MRKLLFLIIFTVLFFSFLENSTAAGIVGVSPGNVFFKNVLREGYAERYVTVTINSDNPVNVEIQPRGEISDWLEYSPNLTISKDSPGQLFIAVKPPRDIPNGNYSGFLRVATNALDEEGIEGHAVSTIRAVLDIALTTEITDLEVLQCKASNFKVNSAEKGDEVSFEIDILNEGNIRLKPEVIINVWDQEQISIVKSSDFTGNEILPTKEETTKFELSTDDLELDQFWVEINVPQCFASETLTFDVLEPGALKAEGILLKLLGPAQIHVEETIPLTANFENIGEKDVDSQFKGQITRDGKIIQVLESEITTTLINKISNFTFFFTPKKSGRYIASGRVFYDKKRTFESSTTISVIPKPFGFKQIFLALVYVIILFLIIILFSKIRKEKKRYIKKIKK